MANALELAYDNYKAGQFVRAAEHCAQALNSDPTSAKALHLLGVIGSNLEQFQSAVSCLELAIHYDPTVPGYFNDLGLVQRRLKLPDSVAISAFRQALALDPEYVPAHLNLGNLLRELKQLDEALSHYRRVVQLEPNHAGAHSTIGVLLAELGQYVEAEVHFRRAAELSPNSLSAQLDLVKILRDVPDLSAAEAHCRSVMVANADSTIALNELAVTLSEQGKYEESEACFRRALQIDPNDAASHCNLGHLFLIQRRFAESIVCLQQALALRGDFCDAWNNLAGATQGLGLTTNDALALQDAEGYYRRALEIKPDAADVHVNLGMLCLMQGRYQEGWREYGWRLKAKARPRSFSQPLWCGESLVGKTILLHVEQGLGDTIQFVRFIPCVRQRGARVLLLCQSALKSLLTGCVGIDVILDENDRLPWFDVHAPLLSLGEILGVTLDHMPGQVPYLFPNPDRVAYWKREFAPFDRLRIGIVWQGNPTHSGDRWRSLMLKQFESLWAAPHVQLFSLQSGFGTEQLSQLRNKDAIVNLDLPLAEKAAAIANLDLVVSCDSAIAHLAGALGQKVWVAIPKIPDWRWMTTGERTHWYPAMHLYRQTVPTDWNPVMERICADLAEMDLQHCHA